MDIKEATPAQVAEFKKAAAERYKERGVPANVAEVLFANQLTKLSEELAIPIEDTPKVDKK